MVVQVRFLAYSVVTGLMVFGRGRSVVFCVFVARVYSVAVCVFMEQLLLLLTISGLLIIWVE